MVFNLKKLSVTYVKGFKEYIKEKGLESWTPEQQYNLFSYAISKLFGLDSSAYARGTSTYGRSCVKYMLELKNTPKKPETVDFADKVQVLSLSQAYFVTTFLMRGKKEVVQDGNQTSL